MVGKKLISQVLNWADYQGPRGNTVTLISNKLYQKLFGKKIAYSVCHVEYLSLQYLTRGIIDQEKKQNCIGT